LLVLSQVAMKRHSFRLMQLCGWTMQLSLFRWNNVIFPKCSLRRNLVISGHIIFWFISFNQFVIENGNFECEKSQSRQSHATNCRIIESFVRCCRKFHWPLDIKTYTNTKCLSGPERRSPGSGLC
jgi:hypothetical protein